MRIAPIFFVTLFAIFSSAVAEWKFAVVEY